MAANKILLKRGTRAQINSAKTSSALNTYEPLWVTDEGRIEMSSAANASVTIARLDDIKVTSVAGRTGDVTLSKTDVGLGNVDNTSDASKPVSTAQQTALNSKLDLSGGTLTGDLILKGDPTAALMAATKQYVDASGGVDYQEFLVSGTWTKPSGLSDDAVVIVEIWGGGGGGAGSGNTRQGGGGGGAYNQRIFRAVDLTATVAVTIGAGGTGTTSNTVAGSGGTTSFGSYVQAFGGGGGSASPSNGLGGDGGGIVTGGGPGLGIISGATGTPQVMYGGVNSATALAMRNSIWGGGAGGAYTNGGAGGSSIWGGGGGGGNAGGTSIWGGNGGGPNVAGQVPGGGGGRGADGGDGKAIVRVIR